MGRGTMLNFILVTGNKTGRILSVPVEDIGLLTALEEGGTEIQLKTIASPSGVSKVHCVEEITQLTEALNAR